jgi:hypothetical protein
MTKPKRQREAIIVGVTLGWALLLFGPVAPLDATQLFATSYDMLNGDNSSPGTSLRDDTYQPDPSGHHNTPYAALSGGLGDLTDGIITNSNWGVAPLPFVGWSDSVFPNPQITFHFPGTVNLDDVQIHMNKDYSAGSVTFSMGGTNITRPVTINCPGGANDLFDFSNLNLTGNTLVVTLNNRAPDGNCGFHDWILIDEVTFVGSQAASAPVPETSTLLLLDSGLAGLASLTWRRNRRG